MKSISEVISDPEFKTLVHKYLNEVIDARRKRQKPRDGYAYVRDAYDTLRKKGNLLTSYFVKNIADIWEKKSEISSNERKLISYVCNRAAFDILSKDTQKHAK